MDSSTGERLVARHLDGTITADECAALNAALVEDPHLAAILVTQARLDAALWATYRRDAVQHQPADAPRGPTGRPAPRMVHRWHVPTAVAATTLMAVGAWFIVATRMAAPVPVFTTSTGAPRAAGAPLAGEQRIPGGGRLLLAPGSRAHAAGSPSHPAVELARGSVACQVAARVPGTSFAVTTPHGAFRVKGTRFTVDVADQTRLGVDEGVVAARAGGQEIDVPAGGFALLTGSAPPALFLPVAAPPLPPPSQWNYRTPGVTVTALPKAGPTGNAVHRFTSTAPSGWTAWIHWHRGDDWSSFTGLSIIHQGSGSGQSFVVELEDNMTQAPHPKSVNACERFTATLHDRNAGWQETRVPFTAFVRMPNQPAIVPQDGLTLTSVHGIALAFAPGPLSLTVERIAPYR